MPWCPFNVFAVFCSYICHTVRPWRYLIDWLIDCLIVISVKMLCPKPLVAMIRLKCYGRCHSSHCLPDKLMQAVLRCRIVVLSQMCVLWLFGTLPMELAQTFPTPTSGHGAQGARVPWRGEGCESGTDGGRVRDTAASWRTGGWGWLFHMETTRCDGAARHEKACGSGRSATSSELSCGRPPTTAVTINTATSWTGNSSTVISFTALRILFVVSIGVGAQSTLGGKTFLPEKYVWSINKIPECYMIIARKNNKILKFYRIFARKMPEFYIIIARKIFSRILGVGGGHVPPLPPRLLRLWLYCVSSSSFCYRWACWWIKMLLIWSATYTILRTVVWERSWLSTSKKKTSVSNLLHYRCGLILITFTYVIHNFLTRKPQLSDRLTYD